MLTQSEIEDLMRQMHARIEQIHLEARTVQDARTGRIEDSITALDALLGPLDAAPGTDSIRAVRQYDGLTMADNAAVAFPLILHGLEILATTTRDIANTIANAK
ncbi:MAG: hypothetical protein ACTIJ6_05285 [Leucobacter sp.]